MLLTAIASAYFSIPSGVAAYGFNELNAQAPRPFQALFGFEDMLAYRTNAVEGVMDVREAIATMIRDTPIEASYIETRHTVTFSVRKEVRVPNAQDDFSAQLIAETCQFGMLPDDRLSRLLGRVQGQCWCCTHYEFELKATPTEYFCAALPAQHACGSYEGTHTSSDWMGAIEEVTITAAAH